MAWEAQKATRGLNLQTEIAPPATTRSSIFRVSFSIARIVEKKPVTTAEESIRSIMIMVVEPGNAKTRPRKTAQPTGLSIRSGLLPNLSDIRPIIGFRINSATPPNAA